MDKKELLSKMAKHGDNQSELAKFLGLTQSALSARMNGHTDFRQKEMNAIRKRYDLSADDMEAIFFAS